MAPNIATEPRTGARKRASEGRFLSQTAGNSGKQSWSKGLIVWSLAVFAGFGPSLWEWARFAWKSELYSYILLVPFISLYFAWSKRTSAWSDERPRAWLAGLLLLSGIGALCGYWTLPRFGWKPTVEDQLALKVFGFLSFLVAGGLFFLRAEAVQPRTFAISFLFFMVPFPEVLRQSIEGFLQHRSADAAQLLFAAAGMPMVRHETIFQLPGFTLEVAPECSGIRSTLVLFLTSLIAGHVFLRSPWRRLVLALAVIPLALVRNGFRIFTIGELCVNVSPEMINSYIHRKGGPIFFVLSLVPFFVLLLLLRFAERRRGKECDGKTLIGEGARTDLASGTSTHRP